MSILIIAEHDNKKLNHCVANIVTAAQQLKQEIHILIAGYECKNVALQAQMLAEITLVLHADSQVYEHQLAENIAELISNLAQDYEYIIAPATTFGKNLLPRVAALLDLEQISDVIQIIAHDTFVRPIYAGNALETVQTNASKKLLTIRKTSFSRCKQGNNCDIKMIDTTYNNQLSSFVDLQSSEQKDLPDLTSAKIIVAGGRGFQSKENFQLLYQLANKMHAAIGATRAAVDAEFIANDHQIGQTGKIVAPDLYIAIGISGAIQHIAGMQESKVIVAINNDPEAPIFKIATYGLVGDLFKLIPEFIDKISIAE